MRGLPSSHTSARPLDSAGRVKRDYLTTALIQTYPAISGGPAKQRVCPALRVLALYRVDQPPEGSDLIHEVKHREREPKLTVQVRHLAGEQYLRHAVLTGLG
jgi:hypothetical protein